MNRDAIALAAVARRRAVAIAAGARRRRATTRVDEIAKYRAALQDGNPAELWEARGEELWKEPRGPNKVSLEQCDLGLGPGVVKGAYAQLPRYFADADRVMDLETRLVWCMVHAAGLSARPTRRRIRSAPATTQVRHRGARRVRHVASRAASKMNVSLDASARRSEMYALGEKMFYLPRRHARFRLRDLPRRGRQAHPPAGPAEPDDEARARRRRTRRGPPIACRRASCARSSGGSTTASASSAFPSSCYGSDASIALTTFLARNANGAAFDAPGDQALTEAIAMRHVESVARGSPRARAPRAASAARRRRRRRSQRQGRGGAEGVVQGAGPGEARPARPGRDAEALQRVRRQGRCRKDVARTDREGESRDDQVSGRRQATSATGRTARRSRRTAAASSISDDPEGPGRRQLLRVPPARRRRSSRTARSARRSTSSASCAATPTRRASTRTARSTTPRRSPRARTCRASATTAS